MPRLKAIHAQKLYRPEVEQTETYPNLQLVLTKPIDWDLVRQQYDQMAKYTTALRLGAAETEAILRRFTRTNVQPYLQGVCRTGQGNQDDFPLPLSSQRGATP